MEQRHQSPILPVPLPTLQVLFTEETVDKKLVKTVRTTSSERGTIEYVLPCDKGDKDQIVFSTMNRPGLREGAPVIMQLGTADPTTALQAARLVAPDVNGIDVNMACPKRFSIQGGMGAALLDNIPNARSILQALVSGVKSPTCSVSCKVRLPSTDTTQRLSELLRLGEECGLSAMHVHCRTPDEDPKSVPARHGILSESPPRLFDFLLRLSPPGDCLRLMGGCSVPLVLSGDVFSLGDVPRLLQASGAQGVMFARGALRNPSVFANQPINKAAALLEYVNLSEQLGNSFQNVKFTATRSFEEGKKSRTHSALQSARTMERVREVLASNVAEMAAGGVCKRQRRDSVDLSDPIDGHNTTEDDAP